MMLGLFFLYKGYQERENFAKTVKKRQKYADVVYSPSPDIQQLQQVDIEDMGKFDWKDYNKVLLYNRLGFSLLVIFTGINLIRALRHFRKLR